MKTFLALALVLASGSAFAEDTVLKLNCSALLTLYSGGSIVPPLVMASVKITDLTGIDEDVLLSSGSNFEMDTPPRLKIPSLLQTSVHANGNVGDLRNTAEGLAYTQLLVENGKTALYTAVVSADPEGQSGSSIRRYKFVLLKSTPSLEKSVVAKGSLHCVNR